MVCGQAFCLVRAHADVRGKKKEGNYHQVKARQHPRKHMAKCFVCFYFGNKK